MKKTFLLLLAGFILLFFSCKKRNIDGQLTGLLKKQDYTTYQYGSHTLTTGSATYALTSKAVNLDRYLNRTVIITGDKIVGYPVDGGPEYIDVKTIK